MIAKKHKTGDRRFVLALCDKDIIGKKISDSKAQLDLSSDFYNGESVDENTLKNLVQEAYIINCVGKESIKFLISFGILEEKNVGYVKETPHAQIVMLRDED